MKRLETLEAVSLQTLQTAFMAPDERLGARRSFWAHVPIWSPGSSGESLESLVQMRATLLMAGGAVVQNHKEENRIKY